MSSVAGPVMIWLSESESAWLYARLSRWSVSRLPRPPFPSTAVRAAGGCREPARAAGGVLVSPRAAGGVLERAGELGEPCGGSAGGTGPSPGTGSARGSVSPRISWPRLAPLAASVSAGSLGPNNIRNRTRVLQHCKLP